MLKCSSVLLVWVGLAAMAYGSPAPFASDPGTYHGRTVVKSFGEHRIAVAVAANGELATHIFRFWSEESLQTFDAAYTTANVEFYGNELVVVAPEAHTILRFTVGRSQTHPHGVPDGFGSSTFSGYGLNHEIRPNGPKKGEVSPYTNCEPDCGEPIFEWPGDGALDCTSGGAGATSCSISQYGQSCSASCDIGYNACCKAGFGGVSCGCVRK